MTQQDRISQKHKKTFSAKVKKTEIYHQSFIHWKQQQRKGMPLPCFDFVYLFTFFFETKSFLC